MISLHGVRVDNVGEEALGDNIELLDAIRPRSESHGAVLDTPGVVGVVDLAEALKKGQQYFTDFSNFYN